MSTASEYKKQQEKRNRYGSLPKEIPPGQRSRKSVSASSSESQSFEYVTPTVTPALINSFHQLNTRVPRLSIRPDFDVSQLENTRLGEILSKQQQKSLTEVRDDSSDTSLAGASATQLPQVVRNTIDRLEQTKVSGKNSHIKLAAEETQSGVSQLSLEALTSDADSKIKQFDSLLASARGLGTSSMKSSLKYVSPKVARREDKKCISFRTSVRAVQAARKFCGRPLTCPPLTQRTTFRTFSMTAIAARKFRGQPLAETVVAATLPPFEEIRSNVSPSPRQSLRVSLLKSRLSAVEPHNQTRTPVFKVVKLSSATPQFNVNVMKATAPATPAHPNTVLRPSFTSNENMKPTPARERKITPVMEQHPPQLHTVQLGFKGADSKEALEHTEYSSHIKLVTDKVVQHFHDTVRSKRRRSAKFKLLKEADSETELTESNWRNLMAQLHEKKISLATDSAEALSQIKLEEISKQPEPELSQKSSDKENSKEDRELEIEEMQRRSSLQKTLFESLNKQKRILSKFGSHDTHDEEDSSGSITDILLAKNTNELDMAEEDDDLPEEFYDKRRWFDEIQRRDSGSCKEARRTSLQEALTESRRLSKEFERRGSTSVGSTSDVWTLPSDQKIPRRLSRGSDEDALQSRRISRGSDEDTLQRRRLSRASDEDTLQRRRMSKGSDEDTLQRRRSSRGSDEDTLQKKRLSLGHRGSSEEKRALIKRLSRDADFLDEETRKMRENLQAEVDKSKTEIRPIEEAELQSDNTSEDATDSKIETKLVDIKTKSSTDDMIQEPDKEKSEETQIKEKEKLTAGEIQDARESNIERKLVEIKDKSLSDDKTQDFRESKTESKPFEKQEKSSSDDKTKDSTEVNAKKKLEESSLPGLPPLYAQNLATQKQKTSLGTDSKTLQITKIKQDVSLPSIAGREPQYLSTPFVGPTFQYLIDQVKRKTENRKKSSESKSRDAKSSLTLSPSNSRKVSERERKTSDHEKEKKRVFSKQESRESRMTEVFGVEKKASSSGKKRTEKSAESSLSSFSPGKIFTITSLNQKKKEIS